jgi:hypothetical protein
VLLLYYRFLESCGDSGFAVSACFLAHLASSISYSGSSLSSVPQLGQDQDSYSVDAL